MPNIADLHRLALSALLGEDVRADHPSAFDHEPDDSQHWLNCIHWAEQRLREGKQSLDVVMLASATNGREARPWVGKILKRELGEGALSEQLAAGLRVAELHEAHAKQPLDMAQLASTLWFLANRTNHPDWLRVLQARSRQLAPRLPGERRKPLPWWRKPQARRDFEAEFAHIASLWRGLTHPAPFFARYRLAHSQANAQHLDW